MCLHSGGPYRNQRKNGERSKATLGLGLDEDYHSLDRHVGEGTQTEAAAVLRHKGTKLCARTSEEARRSLWRPVSPDKEHRDTGGKGE